MKGIVITTDDQFRVQDFSLPLYKSVGAAVGGARQPEAASTPVLSAGQRGGAAARAAGQLLGQLHVRHAHARPPHRRRRRADEECLHPRRAGHHWSNRQRGREDNPRAGAVAGRPAGICSQGGLTCEIQSLPRLRGAPRPGRALRLQGKGKEPLCWNRNGS